MRRRTENLLIGLAGLVLGLALDAVFIWFYLHLIGALGHA